MSTTELFLRDVIDIKEDVHAGDFKVDLSQGFHEADERVAEYVVTEQLQKAFRKALGIVAKAVRTGDSHAAYLHGSFGAGKSHFLTVLHAVLNGHDGALDKRGLKEVVGEHRDWLGGSRFLMIPYHLVGSTDLDSALLGGYVHTVRELHPDVPTPAVYRSDALLADADRQRKFLGDDDKFRQWLGAGAAVATPGGGAEDDEDDLPGIDGGADLPGTGGWSSAELDRAFAAPPGSEERERLVSALLTGPMAAYTQAARGDAHSFIPLENGLKVISRHARSLGYDGVVLFLDELILWLQAHMGDQDFVRDQVQRLVKLIESADSGRPVPIVSFISRQRDLSQLIGSDVAGADVQNLEQQVDYLAGRLDVVELEDSNLVEIIKHRVLAPRPGMEQARDDAFKLVESSRDEVRQVLLDAQGRTEASWDDFRTLYPLSPALLNVLVDLSGALQRERTGLKLVQELLRRHRDDLRLGQLVPIGDLWDVIAERTGEAFTAKLRKESEIAHRFHARVREHLLTKYGSADDKRFQTDERLVKTLLLASLAPNVPALTRLTGGRLAALNHGTIRTRVGDAGAVAVKRLQELQAEGFDGELRSEGDPADPVFHLHLSDLDVEPLLEEVQGVADQDGYRRQWIKDQLWAALGIPDAQAFVCERTVVWRGTKRTVEFVFGNVRDPHLPDAEFSPQTEGNLRFVFDYPFDDHDHSPMDDVQRVERMKRAGRTVPTIVWLPHFLSEQKARNLGRLLKINYLLERDRLDDHTATRPAEERIQIRNQLKASRDSLTSQLTDALLQLYGINRADPGTAGAEVPEGHHLISLQPGFTRTRPEPAVGFEENLLLLADGLLSARHPKHPDFDPRLTRKAVTTRELKTTLEWITRAMEDGSRRVVVDSQHLPVVRRIVHALQLGEVHDGPLNVTTDWRLRINKKAAETPDAGPELSVDDIRRWIEDLGYTGLDRHVSNLIIATYALLDDRTWVYQTSPLPKAPELERIGPGYGLRAVELPTEDEFHTALGRAGTIFGRTVSRVLFARNVARLAEGVRAVAEEHRVALGEVRTLLTEHAAHLGLTGPGGADAPRLKSTKAAADLVARLLRTAEPAACVRELAAAAYDVTDEEIAGALRHAPEVAAALRGTDWSLLDTVRRDLVVREDSVGERAARFLDEVHRTARDHEQAISLVPVLDRLPDTVMALLREATRLAQAAQPAQPATPPAPVTPEPTAEDVSLTDHGKPPVPSTPAQDQPSTPDDASRGQGGAEAVVPARAGRRPAVHLIEPTRLEVSLATTVAELDAEIRAYLAAHPGTRIQVTWQPVTETGSGPDGSAGSAAEPGDGNAG
ncbi:PglY protein [Streptomyces sp. CB03238]|uniref:PglY protein n=1 Tax=Streptomyces sp. CB03238 TaxID=1907777 RepID=UPI000A114243|nr:PglY protein [Streptomyces sp. CB03238]ORT59286.1 PglY protein [Streptomyces sp. CB03238]